MPRIGVLALQGDFRAHGRVLRGLGADAVDVRRVAQLTGLDGMVIPGGESSTLLHLMADEPWFESIRGFHEGGGALMGTCAGAILLSREVVGRGQPSLGLLDAGIARNAFGRQADSFETTLEAPSLGGPLEAVFIRAPKFLWTGPDVEVLARYGGEPVMVREGRVLAMTFHPELTPDARPHAYFLSMAKTADTIGVGATVPARRQR